MRHGTAAQCTILLSCCIDLLNLFRRIESGGVADILVDACQREARWTKAIVDAVVLRSFEAVAGCRTTEYGTNSGSNGKSSWMRKTNCSQLCQLRFDIYQLDQLDLLFADKVVK